MSLYLILFLFALVLGVAVTLYLTEHSKIKRLFHFGKSNDTKDSQDAPKA